MLYTHFSPAAGAHASEHLIKSQADLAGAIADAVIADKGDYKLFIGSHFPGKGTAHDLSFLSAYPEHLCKASGKAGSAKEIVVIMNKLYPVLKGEEASRK